MINERIVIRAKEFSDEDLYFQEQDKKKIEGLRAMAAKDADESYLNAHRYRFGPKHFGIEAVRYHGG